MSTLSVNAIDKSAFLKVILVLLSYTLPGYLGYLIIRNFIFFPASMAGLAKILGFSVIGA